MKDADLRLTDDVQRLAHGCTSFFTQGVRTGTTLVSFGGLVVWQFGANQKKDLFSLFLSLSLFLFSLFSLSFSLFLSFFSLFLPERTYNCERSFTMTGSGQ